MLASLLIAKVAKLKKVLFVSVTISSNPKRKMASKLYFLSQQARASLKREHLPLAMAKWLVPAPDRKPHECIQTLPEYDPASRKQAVLSWLNAKNRPMPRCCLRVASGLASFWRRCHPRSGLSTCIYLRTRPSLSTWTSTSPATGAGGDTPITAGKRRSTRSRSLCRLRITG